jgi:hypothetical protein
MRLTNDNLTITKTTKGYGMNHEPKCPICGDVFPREEFSMWKYGDNKCDTSGCTGELYLEHSLSPIVYLKEGDKVKLNNYGVATLIRKDNNIYVFKNIDGLMLPYIFDIWDGEIYKGTNSNIVKIEETKGLFDE